MAGETMAVTRPTLGYCIIDSFGPRRLEPVHATQHAATVKCELLNAAWGGYRYRVLPMREIVTP